MLPLEEFSESREPYTWGLKARQRLVLQCFLIVSRPHQWDAHLEVVRVRVGYPDTARTNRMDLVREANDLIGPRPDRCSAFLLSRSHAIAPRAALRLGSKTGSRKLVAAEPFREPIGDEDSTWRRGFHRGG